MTAPTQLRPRLDEAKRQIGEMAPAEHVAVLTAEQSRLTETSDVSAMVKPGDRLPAVTLPDPNGKGVDLAALTATGTAVIVFYRGAWCPYCNVTLRAYQEEVLPELEQRGIPLVAISPQGPDGSTTIAENNNLTFPVLTDSGSAFAKQLGIVFPLTEEVQSTHVALGNDFDAINDGGERELPMPTVIVTKDGVVTFADPHPDYTTRTEPDAVLEAVRATY